MAALAFMIVPTGREVAAAFTARAEAAHRAAGVAGCSGMVVVWGEPGMVVPITTNAPSPPIQVGDGPYAIAITP